MTSAADEVRGAPSGRRRRRRYLVLVLLVLLGLWGAAAARSGYTAARDLEQAREHLSDVERLLRDAELSEARAELEEAVDASARAADRLTAPHVVPLRVVPWLGPNLRAATELSIAARDVGGDAGSLLDVAAVIVNDDRNQDLGEVSIEYVSELAPPTRALVTSLQAAYDRILAMDPEPLLGPIVRARELFVELVEPNLDQATVAADLLEVLPAFLGEDEPRTYLVGAAALSELRGSGGLIGAWTLLRIDEGRMSFGEFVDLDEMPEVTRQVWPPEEEFGARYQGLGSLYNWRNVNLSPDFPAVAQVILDLHDQSSALEVDGVVVADTVVFERLAQRSGGLDVPGVGFLPPDEVLRFVALDAYDVFDSDEERKRVLGATATSAFQQLFQLLEDDDVPATAEMLADIARGGHLRMYVRDQQVQTVLERAGVAGGLPADPGESVGVFVNNFAENKLDFFAERAVQHRVRLEEDGFTRSEIVVSLANGAPTEGHRRGVLGPWVDDLEAGDTRWHLLFTCGVGCELLESPRLDHVGGTERGRTVHDHLTTVRSGEDARVTYATRTPDGWSEVDGRIHVEVEHLVQPTLHGTTVEVVVELPDDAEVVELPPDARVDDGEVVWEGVTSGAISLPLVLDGSSTLVRAES